MAKIERDPFLEQIDLPEADQELIRLYDSVGRTVDDLAYTAEFDSLYNSYRALGYDRTKHEVFRRLLVLRKSGLLPRLFRSHTEPAA